MALVAISNQGEVVIPKSIRKSLGLVSGDKLIVKQEGNKVIIFKNKKDPKEFFVNAGPDAIERYLETS
ncbi:MAG: AbrB/MazE/SpoVT family DNA-binding domain-containing protein, partial [Methanosarcinales archaeon]